MSNLPQKNRANFSFFLPEEDGMIRWLKSISILSALISLIVFTDYFLPLRESIHIVKEKTVRTGFEEFDLDEFDKLDYKTGEEEFWLILDDEEMAVSETDIKNQMIGDSIVIFRTSIFGLHVKMQNNTDDKIFYPYLSVFGWLFIFPILFMIIFLLNFFYSKKQELIISLGVINIILLVGFGFLVLFY